MFNYKNENVINLEEYKKNKDKIEVAKTLKKTILAKHKIIIENIIKREEIIMSIERFDENVKKELDALEELLKKYFDLTGEELNITVGDVR